jgi:hypothetical protein
MTFKNLTCPLQLHSYVRITTNNLVIDGVMKDTFWPYACNGDALSDFITNLTNYKT